MKKVLLFLLLCLALSTNAYAYRIDNVILNDTSGSQLNPKGVATSVSSGTVVMGASSTALGSSLAIWRVTIRATNAGAGYVYIGDSALTTKNGYALATNDTVTIETDNLADLYAVGTYVSDSIVFIAEVK